MKGINRERKARLRVTLEVLPQIHSYSSSCAHALSVTVTSTHPFYSSAWLRRRTALLSSHSYTATLFPYFWVDNVQWVEISVQEEEAEEEEEEEEEAPCLVSSEHIRFPIMLRSWSELAWDAKLCRWNYVIFVHRAKCDPAISSNHCHRSTEIVQFN